MKYVSVNFILFGDSQIWHCLRGYFYHIFLTNVFSLFIRKLTTQDQPVEDTWAPPLYCDCLVPQCLAFREVPHPLKCIAVWLVQPPLLDWHPCWCTKLLMQFNMTSNHHNLRSSLCALTVVKCFQTRSSKTSTAARHYLRLRLLLFLSVIVGMSFRTLMKCWSIKDLMSQPPSSRPRQLMPDIRAKKNAVWLNLPNQSPLSQPLAKPFWASVPPLISHHYLLSFLVQFSHSLIAHPPFLKSIQIRGLLP